MPEIQIVMVNGDKHRFTFTVPEGQNMDDVLENARDDTGPWITADDGFFLRRENVISMRLQRERREPLVSAT